MAGEIRIGVLALQGDFEKHLQTLQRCGVKAQEVRKVSELEGIDGLILPGGESTTIGRLMNRYSLDKAIRERVREGMPLYGTCAGLILMAKQIEGSDQPRLGVMDIVVERNAFGRQIESFEVDLPFKPLGDPPVRAVFIRAPIVSRVQPGVEVLAEFEGKMVAVQQAHLLATAFHPELTEDTRVHEYFVEIVKRAVG